MHRNESTPDSTINSLATTTLDGQEPPIEAGALEHQVGLTRTKRDVLPPNVPPGADGDADRSKNVVGAAGTAPAPASGPGGRGSDWPASGAGGRGSGWPALVAAMDEAELRRLVVSLPVIEQAKGVLMGFYGCGAERAFAILRRWSSVHHVKVSDLAAVVVAHTEAQPSHRGDPAGPAGEWRPFHALQAFLEQTGLG